MTDILKTNFTEIIKNQDKNFDYEWHLENTFKEKL